MPFGSDDPVRRSLSRGARRLPPPDELDEQIAALLESIRADARGELPGARTSAVTLPRRRSAPSLEPPWTHVGGRRLLGDPRVREVLFFAALGLVLAAGIVLLVTQVFP